MHISDICMLDIRDSWSGGSWHGHTHVLGHVRLDSLRGSSVKIGTMQRRLAWSLLKYDTHKSRGVSIF